MTENAISRYFIFRRLHSLTGFWLTLYIIMHLLTNSQAVFLLGDDGHGFIKAVNDIHLLPYLPEIEIIVLALPILLHTIWGILYLRGVQFNSFYRGAAKPYLPEFGRNHAYTWQRITAVILVFGLFAHIVHMRFIEYPDSVKVGSQNYFLVRLKLDEGLYTLSERLNVHLYDAERIRMQEELGLRALAHTTKEMNAFDRLFGSLFAAFSSEPVNDKQRELVAQQQLLHAKNFIETLKKKPLQEGQVVAVAPDFGTAELLMVRETFKHPLMIVLYTLFVLAACYHGFNGLWTFMISWGVTLTPASQRLMKMISSVLMAIVAFLGLSTIFLTYWVNLKQ